MTDSEAGLAVVYIVSSGEYDDYRIDSVHADLESAKAAWDKFERWKPDRIEVWPLGGGEQTDEWVRDGLRSNYVWKNWANENA